MLAETADKRESNDNGTRKTRAGKVRLPSLKDIDQRTAAFRDIVQIRDKLASERGGADSLDVRTLASLESWAVATTIIKGVEISWLQGLPVDFAEYSSLLNARRREGELIGDPSPRDVTPDLNRYIRGAA